MNNLLKPLLNANLRTRIRIFGLLTILGVAIFAFMLTFTFVSDRAARLEAAQTKTAIQKALNALEEELYRLEVTASDLAIWDDTFAFVGSPDPTYIDTYLTNEYYFQSGINLITLIDSSQAVIYSRALDLNEKREIRLDIQEHLTPDSPLTAGLEQKGNVSGILFVNDFPMLVTSYPVLRSNGEGPARGALIMGRFIDDAVLLQLEGDLQFSLKIDPASKILLPEGFWPPDQEDPVVVEPLNNATVVGYLLLNDIYGNQSLILRGFLPRTIYNESIQNAALLSLVIILLVSASLVFFMWIFDRKVLKRLAHVDTFIQNYDAARFNNPPHLTLTGEDELTRMSVSLNEMIDRLSETQRDLNMTAEENIKLSQQAQEQYEKEKEIRQALQAEIEKRIEFTEALGHELRTPITPILASIDLMKRHTEDSRSKELLQIVERSATNLNKRMGSILDLAKAEVNMLSLDLSKVNPGEILEEVSKAMEIVAIKNGQKIISEIPDDLPATITDKDRFQRVIENIIDNALKYTPSGGTVILRAKEENKNLVVEVRDSGIGISEEEKAVLFEPYRRRSGKERLGGLSVGLAFSKIFIDLQGGHIWVNSESGKGSVFGFSLPLQLLNENRETPGAER